MIMLRKLIERSNEKEFYQNSWLLLKSINYKTEKINLCEINLFLDDRDFNEDTIIKQDWKIIATEFYQINNFWSENLLPYIKLELLEEHPLLWEYKNSTLECQLSELPNEIHQFIGNLYFALEKITGNWISFQNIIFGIQQFHRGNNKVRINIPEPLKETFKAITNKYNIKFEIIKENKIDKDDYSEIKILIFGNRDVSPNEYNFGQPYIIAKDFSAIVTNLQ